MIVSTAPLQHVAVGLGAWLFVCAIWLEPASLGPPGRPRHQAAPAQAAQPVVREAEPLRQDLDVRSADLSWLEGSWAGSDGESDWESVYSGPNGGAIVGPSRELKGERCVMFDFEHFHERAGSLRMTPHPFGKPSVEFTLTSYQAAGRSAVFENPEHDFPKVFTYTRAADDRLTIALEGEMGGREVEFTLDLRRVDG